MHAVSNAHGRLSKVVRVTNLGKDGGAFFPLELESLQCHERMLNLPTRAGTFTKVPAAMKPCHQTRESVWFDMTAIFALVVVLLSQAHFVRGSTNLVGCPGRAFATAETGDTFWLQSNPDLETYSVNRTCEWLINGTSDSVMILDFETFDTECGFDFVYVYDGDGFDPSTVMVAQSGNTLPSSIVAYSGTIHVILFSDVNYARSGLVANLTVTTCNSSCGVHGVCQLDNTCRCASGWSGWDCSIELCPNDCGISNGHGQCSSDGSFCVCDENRAGTDCSISPTSDNTWYTLRSTASEEVLPWEIARAGHTSTVLNETHVWTLGGYTLGSHAVADDVNIDLITLETSVLPTTNPIDGRYWHTAALAQQRNEILIFGGIIVNNATATDGRYTNELWSLDIETLAYTNRSSHGSTPSSLATHTASMVSRDTMVVLGGTIDASGTFSQLVWILNTSTYTWRSVVPAGEQVQLSGHTASYHEGTDLIYVIGGFLPVTNGYNARSSSLFTYNPTTHFWTLRSPDNAAVMPPLALHSAALVGDNVVIYGGNQHTPFIDEQCYGMETLVYNVQCDSWSALPSTSAVPRCTSAGGDSTTCAAMTPGRMSHTSFAGGASSQTRGGFVGNSDAAVYVFGGYSGVVRGDLLALSVALPTPSTCVTTRCAAYTGCWACARDVACGWDAPAEACVVVGGDAIASAVECPGNVSTVAPTAAWGEHGVVAATWHNGRSYDDGEPPDEYAVGDTFSVNAGSVSNVSTPEGNYAVELRMGLIAPPAGSYVLLLRTQSTATVFVNGL
eukprot:m.123217 g.123217  ORF g.123217 m.123217 type:complete len:788 (+) comp17278_c2_seq17:41-2404(+)